MKNRRFLASVLPLVLFLSFASTTNAQFDLDSLRNVTSGFGGVSPFGQISPGVDAQFVRLGLVASPSYPEPFSTFTVDLRAPSSDYTGATIRWYQDGEAVTAANNMRSHDFRSGALGEQTRIEARITRTDGVSETATLSVIPTQVDIVVEGHTTVPNFYKGRPLPIRQAPVRVNAIVHNGENLNRSQLSYEWRLNNNPLSGGGIKGQSGINFTMPLDRESYIGVTIQDGTRVIADKTIVVPVAEPEVLFYEDNALRGQLTRAVTDNHRVFGNQVTLRAVPYYMPDFIGSDEFLLEWTLNGQKTDTRSNLEPNVLTLRGSGSFSTANVGFKLVNTTKLGQNARDAITLRFGQ